MTEPNPYQPPAPIRAELVTRILPIGATGVLSASDAIRALRAVGKWRTWTYYALAAALALVGAVMFVPTAQGKISLLTIAFFGVSFLFLLTYPQIVRIRFERSWKARPEYQKPITWVFSEDGIFVETSHSKQQQSWNTFLYAKFTAHEIIFAHHGNMHFNFVPIRFFASEQDVTAARDLIAAKLPLR